MPPSSRRGAARALRAESHSRGNGFLSGRLSGRAGKWLRLTDQRNKARQAQLLRQCPKVYKRACRAISAFLFNLRDGFVQVFKAKAPSVLRIIKASRSFYLSRRRIPSEPCRRALFRKAQNNFRAERRLQSIATLLLRLFLIKPHCQRRKSSFY